MPNRQERRSIKNRAPRPGRVSTSRAAGTPRTESSGEIGPNALKGSEVMTFEWGDIMMTAKFTGKKVHPLTGSVTMGMVPYQDHIHPYPLAFEPPLQEYASGSPKGFSHHWEKLNYVFALPDPSKFPTLPIAEDDRVPLKRFVAVCKDLAGYTTITSSGGLRMSKAEGGDWSVSVSFPSKESFGGTSLAFRQLHNGKEAASFDVVKGRLFKAVKLLPTSERSTPSDVITQWASARGTLMNQLLPTAVCFKAAPGTPPDDFPISYRNVHPETLLHTFNYGDTIHFTDDRREDLAALLEDERNEAYYKHAVLTAITGLSHLYFGFAVLIEAALGE